MTPCPRCGMLREGAICPWCGHDQVADSLWSLSLGSVLVLVLALVVGAVLL